MTVPVADMNVLWVSPDERARWDYHGRLVGIEHYVRFFVLVRGSYLSSSMSLIPVAGWWTFIYFSCGFLVQWARIAVHCRWQLDRFTLCAPWFSVSLGLYREFSSSPRTDSLCLFFSCSLPSNAWTAPTYGPLILFLLSRQDVNGLLLWRKDWLSRRDNFYHLYKYA